jgi:hypothetical protein
MRDLIDALAQTGRVDFEGLRWDAWQARVAHSFLRQDQSRTTECAKRHAVATRLREQGLKWTDECAALCEALAKDDGRGLPPSPLRSAVTQVHDLLVAIQRAHGRIGKPEYAGRWIAGMQADAAFLMLLRPPRRPQLGRPSGLAVLKPNFRRAMQARGVTNKDHREEFLTIVDVD